ncbi:MAG TPA: ECF-type sigma factor [Rhodanobacteraceae bacterium]|jgi:RNA polymerase sigma factor (TIGR02999 family)
MADADDITELLNAAQSGDSDAQATAYAMVYEELKRCARRQKALAPGSSLSPTAIVSELYLRLSGGHRSDRIRNRAHFFALAARAMRQIVVDHARRRTSLKRGGAADHTDVATLDLATATAEQALELDAALTTLAQRDADLAQLVEWHFFAGLTFEEIAEELGHHERTVRRDWELARACLQQSMSAATTS